MERIIPVTDTGFIVALLNRTDRRHHDVTPLYQKFDTILFPQTTLVEVAYLIGRTGRIERVWQFLRGLSASRFHVIALIEFEQKSIDGCERVTRLAQLTAA